MNKKPFKKVVLVYQAGIANVFAVDDFNFQNPTKRNARRLLQYDFNSCENFARGIAACGVPVMSAHCNMAGDITNQQWDADVRNAPFFENMAPVQSF